MSNYVDWAGVVDEIGLWALVLLVAWRGIKYLEGRKK